MSASAVAAEALGAAALAWAAIYAASRVDLAKWVWLPALRVGAASSLAAMGLLMMGLPVPLHAPLALTAAGLVAGLAGARIRRRRRAVGVQ